MSRVKTTTTVSYIRSRQQNYAQILSWGFCCFCFRDLIFCLFWMRKHQKLHKRAARPKTYDSRGRHLSDYNNSSNNRSGSEAMKQSAQLNWGPRHSSRPMKMAKKRASKTREKPKLFLCAALWKIKNALPTRVLWNSEWERECEIVSKSLSGSSLVQASAAATKKPPADY